jgi:metal-responsive CopG/Arc/MetJ family transcriptional regulator
MKTAVSIPDKVFRRAEALAKELEISRSELYATALASFLEEHDERNVTERLNKLYSQQEAKLDPVLAELQFRALPPEDW